MKLPKPAIHVPFLCEVRKVLQGDYFTADQVRDHMVASALAVAYGPPR